MKNPVILFDLGNVLVSIHPGAFTRHLGIDPATAYRKYQKRILSIVRKYEGGGGTTEEYLGEMSRLFDGRYDLDLIREAMLKVVGTPIEGMEELVSMIASKYETGLVSNTNELHFNYCRDTFSMLRHFSRFYLSYQLSSLKPAETYYNTVLADLKVLPSSIVFVDDMEENVFGARKSGMNALRFVSRRQLEQDFRSLSVL
jgi:putative hydrolase of the HAD superfamily